MCGKRLFLHAFDAMRCIIERDIGLMGCRDDDERDSFSSHV